MKRRDIIIVLMMCILYTVGYGQELESRAKEGAKRAMTASEIYHRIQRVGYERELKIDSAKAMVLVLADEIVQQRIHSILENQELTINSKALEIKRAKDEREQVFRKVLTKEQLAKVYGTADRKSGPQVSKNEKVEKSSVMPPLDITKTSTEESERIHLQHIRELQERQNRIFERSGTKPVPPERRVPLITQDQGK